MISVIHHAVLSSIYSDVLFYSFLGLCVLGSVDFKRCFIHVVRKNQGEGSAERIKVAMSRFSWALEAVSV